jgi:hypothetical protein
MAIGRFVCAALGLVLLGTLSARAADVRYYQQNGVTYRETRRVVEERIPESRMVEREQTVYREQFTTEMRPSTRTYCAPVTEYRWEAYWVGRWNPLAQPYLAYRCVPRTHWEQRIETVDVPVNVRRLVPESRVVRQPVAGWRTAQREVVDRVAVGRSPVRTFAAPAPAPVLASRPQIGGISRLDNDPPRLGVSTAWRASSATFRR